MQRFRNEFKGWRLWEVLWLAANCVIILGLSLYWEDSVIGIFSALTGIAYVVCNGKGKLMAYVFGVALLLRGLLVLHAFLYLCEWESKTEQSA